MSRFFASWYSCARVRSPPEREPPCALGLPEDLLEDDELLRLDPLLAPGLLLLERELLERELPCALGLLLLLPEDFLLLALARDEPDFDDDVLVSPRSARSLFTVRAAISAARPFWPRFS